MFVWIKLFFPINCPQLRIWYRVQRVLSLPKTAGLLSHGAGNFGKNQRQARMQWRPQLGFAAQKNTRIEKDSRSHCLQMEKTYRVRLAAEFYGFLVAVSSCIRLNALQGSSSLRSLKKAQVSLGFFFAHRGQSSMCNCWHSKKNSASILFWSSSQSKPLTPLSSLGMTSQI